MQGKKAKSQNDQNYSFLEIGKEKMIGIQKGFDGVRNDEFKRFHIKEEYLFQGPIKEKPKQKDFFSKGEK